MTLRKSSTSGHLVKNTDGHLVKGCGCNQCEPAIPDTLYVKIEDFGGDLAVANALNWAVPWRGSAIGNGCVWAKTWVDYAGAKDVYISLRWDFHIANEWTASVRVVDDQAGSDACEMTFASVIGNSACSPNVPYRVEFSCAIGDCDDPDTCVDSSSGDINVSETPWP